MLHKITIPLLLLLFIGCGGGSESSEPEIKSSPLKESNLYSFNLNLVEHRQTYEIKEIDAVNSNLLYKYFDFSTDDYEFDVKDKQIFVDGKREGFSDINYRLKTDRSILSVINNKNIFELSILEENQTKIKSLKPYTSEIKVSGIQYTAELKYLSNFFILKDLFSSESFDNLETFSEQYKESPFIGSTLNGLTFGKDNTVLQHIDTTSTKVGKYTIQTVDKRNVLLINFDTVTRHGSNLCYLLDFSRVWKAECHVQNSKEYLYFYDENIYNGVLEYMQNNFTDVKVEI